MTPSRATTRTDTAQVHDLRWRKQWRLWPPVLVSVALSVAGTGLAGDTSINMGHSDRDAHQVLQQLLLDLNGDIFWAPASGFTSEDSWMNIFGDEARSVFGPIPSVDCTKEIAPHTEVDGNRVDLERSENDGYIFVHRDPSNAVVARSHQVPRCDKPSLANTAGHPCATNTRIALLANDANEVVDWVALCRKSELGSVLTSFDDYWLAENTHFALLGIIGFNAGTGEVVFFDGTNFARGSKRLTTFNGSKKLVPPGGDGYDDHRGRKEAAGTYFYTQRVPCETCHDNKDPWIMTPHLKTHGIGYHDAARERGFAVDNILPLVQPRSDTDPYRVVGTRFTKLADLSSRTFRDPSGNCTGCHTLTTDWTGNVLAYDAVGRVNPRQPYRSFFEKLENARTDWSWRDRNVNPWMVPIHGPNVIPDASKPRPSLGIDDADWERIADCIDGTSVEECHYRPAFTTCPAPESIPSNCSLDGDSDAGGVCSQLADPFGPSDMTVSLSPVPKDKVSFGATNTMATIQWTYLNGLGAVPQRDDVRFNLAIRESGIPPEERAPASREYPSLAATFDPFHHVPDKRGRLHYCDLEGVRERTCHILDGNAGTYLLNNISYWGHTRNSTPKPAREPRQYQIQFPVRCNSRYLVRLVPKRFCFDRSGVLASDVDHVTYFDVTCG